MYNSTTLVGHIGQDCTTKTLDGGRVVTQFSIAHTETWKDATGQKQERTTWFNCSYFTATTPGVGEYLRKGALILVTGRVSARAYLDQHQKPAASLDITVGEIRLISTPKREESTNPAGYREGAFGSVEPAPAQPATNSSTAADGDDLPF